MRRLVITLALILASCGAGETQLSTRQAAPVATGRLDRLIKAETTTTTTTAAPATTTTRPKPKPNPTTTVAKVPAAAPTSGCGKGNAYYLCADAVSSSGERRPADQFRRVGWCETRGETSPWTAKNRAGSSAGGYWQIVDGTWNGYGGYAHAREAPADVQTAKASQLWAGGAGSSHWSSTAWCWR